jgi:uncharacterized protein
MALTKINEPLNPAEEVPKMNQISSLEKPGLKELILWVTTDCNLRCRYCYANGGDDAQYMDWPVAKQAIDLMLSRSEGFKIQFAGGEPLLNLELIEQVVGYTEDLHIRYELQTNATLIDANMARSLKRLGIAVGVSLDGLPAINDHLRPFPDGQGSTMTTIIGVENLRTEGIRVGLTCVLSAENIAGLPGLVELASYLGNVEGIAFDPLRPIGRDEKGGVRQADFTLTARSVSTALERADELTLMGGRKVKFREVERMHYLLTHGLSRQHHCFFDAGQLLIVKPNGDAYPCASLTGFPEFHLGNIMEEDFAERLAATLEKTRQLVTHPAQCLICPDRRLCGGPCPAQTYARQLAGEAEPTECYIKRAFINYVKRKGNPSHASAKQISFSV